MDQIFSAPKGYERISMVGSHEGLTRLGDFGIYFITKVAQMCSDCLGCCEKHCFLNEIFWVNILGKTWATFYSNI